MDNFTYTPDNGTLKDTEDSPDITTIIRELHRQQSELDDIKENHLNSIFSSLMHLDDEIKQLRWMIGGGTAIIGIVLAILQVFG